MAASGIFQTRKSRTHQYFTNQKTANQKINFPWPNPGLKLNNIKTHARK